MQVLNISRAGRSGGEKKGGYGPVPGSNGSLINVGLIDRWLDIWIGTKERPSEQARLKCLVLCSFFSQGSSLLQSVPKAPRLRATLLR